MRKKLIAAIPDMVRNTTEALAGSPARTASVTVTAIPDITQTPVKDMQDGDIMRIPGNVSFRTTNIYCSIAVTAGKYLKILADPESLYADSFIDPRKSDYSGYLEEIEKPENCHLLLARYPGLGQLEKQGIPREDIRFLCLHKLQYERLLKTAPAAAPVTRFIIGDFGAYRKPVIVQEAIAGTSLYAMSYEDEEKKGVFLKDEWKPRLHTIARQLVPFFDSDHFDFNHHNFMVTEDNRVFYVDTKPSVVNRACYYTIGESKKLLFALVEAYILQSVAEKKSKIRQLAIAKYAFPVTLLAELFVSPATFLYARLKAGDIFTPAIGYSSLGIFYPDALAIGWLTVGTAASVKSMRRCIHDLQLLEALKESLQYIDTEGH